jgi:hypothetical protein
VRTCQSVAVNWEYRKLLVPNIRRPGRKSYMIHRGEDGDLSLGNGTGFLVALPDRRLYVAGGKGVANQYAMGYAPLQCVE